MSTLADYIKNQPPRPMREWADHFGISRAHLIALVEQDRMPSLPVARRIQERTQGAVPIRAWPNFAAIIEAAKDNAA